MKCGFTDGESDLTGYAGSGSATTARGTIVEIGTPPEYSSKNSNLSEKFRK
jgi:hypothetical protein